MDGVHQEQQESDRPRGQLLFHFHGRGGFFDREELRGREMIVIESALELPDMDAAADEMMLPLGDWGHLAESLSTQYMIRDGGRLMLASDPVALDDALRVIDGAANKSLADNANYQALEEMIPGGKADVKVMMLTEPFSPLSDQLFAGPAAAAMPIMQELFGSVGGFGVWMSMATEGNGKGWEAMRSSGHQLKAVRSS